ncbi:D-alanyl-D-alanine carboxypeptidase [Patescibacteria group bacterium]|nr:MAG: D-alanyl-D-alanine carboxypeptidase [Patescibacteria group bacterium]
MKQKLKEFLFSYGLIIAGVFLLFVSTLTLAIPSEENENLSLFKFPPYSVASIGGDFFSQKPPVPLAMNSSTFDATMTAFSAVAMDFDSKAVLFSKNAREARPLASVTKLMTMMTLLDLPIDFSRTETITEADSAGGDHHLQTGEKYSLEQLWQVALVGSSNVAINALVRASGLSTEEFVAKMNKKAGDYKLSSAVFVEPTGLSAQNIASAFDAAKLLRESLRYEKIYQTLRLPEYAGRTKEKVWSTNWLLTGWIPNDFARGDIIGKTGYIPGSRYNFAGNFIDEKGRSLVTVVLGADANESRFTEARDLADWVFANYLWPRDAGYDELAR